MQGHRNDERTGVGGGGADFLSLRITYKLSYIYQGCEAFEVGMSFQICNYTISKFLGGSEDDPLWALASSTLLFGVHTTCSKRDLLPCH